MQFARACLFAMAALSSVSFAQLQVGTVQPTDIELQVDAASPRVERVIEAPGASFLRVHVAYADLAAGERLELRDRLGAAVQAFEGQAIVDAWSWIIRGDRALVVLSSQQAARGSACAIDAIVRGYPQALGVPCLAQCGDNVECVASLPEYSRRTPVAKMHSVVGSMAMAGTGWMIGSPDCLITNWHVVDGAATSSLLAEFNCECDACVNGSPRPTTFYAVEAVLDARPEYDYALLDLTGPAAVTWGVLPVNKQPPAIGEDVYVLHHSGGEPKGISYGRTTEFVTRPQTCNVHFVQTLFEIGYDAARGPGSSGSPVLCRSTHVVEALHHCGPGSGNCPVGTGIPTWLITPMIEPVLSANGCTFQFVDSHCSPCACAATYCQGWNGGPSCLTRAWSSGCPSMSSQEPFFVFATNVPNNKQGLLFGGVTPLSFDWHGCSTLCISPPTFRMPIQSSHGHIPGSDCSGLLLSDINPRIQSGQFSFLQVGTAVYMQSWYRDPGNWSCTNGWALSLGDALVFTILP